MPSQIGINLRVGRVRNVGLWSRRSLDRLSLADRGGKSSYQKGDNQEKLVHQNAFQECTLQLRFSLRLFGGNLVKNTGMRSEGEANAVFVAKIGTSPEITDRSFLGVQSKIAPR